MKPVGSKLIETERLILRRIELGDVDSVYEYAHREEVAMYVTFYPHQSVEDSKEIVSKWVQEYVDEYIVRYAITLKDTGVLIGVCDYLRQDENENSAEIGIVVNPNYAGNGYATEAIRALTYYGFKCYGLSIIYYAYVSENIPSSRVAGKNFFVYDSQEEREIKGIKRTMFVTKMSKDFFLKLDREGFYKEILIDVC